MNIFKLAQKGFNAIDAKIGDEVLDSRYPSPKVDTAANPPHAGIIAVNWATANITLPIGASKILYTLPHNYGYTPSVIASFNFDNGSTKLSGILPFSPANVSSSSYIGTIECYSDATSVVFRYKFVYSGVTPVDPFLIKIHYYIFAERAYEA